MRCHTEVKNLLFPKHKGLKEGSQKDVTNVRQREKRKKQGANEWVNKGI